MEPCAARCLCCSLLQSEAEIGVGSCVAPLRRQTECLAITSREYTTHIVGAVDLRRPKTGWFAHRARQGAEPCGEVLGLVEMGSFASSLCDVVT